MTGSPKTLAEKYRIKAPDQLGYDACILVIEDQTDLRLIVVHQLRKLTYTDVRQATNGYEALEMIREEKLKVEAIICDMDMPVMGGLDLLQELRESTDIDRGPFCITMDSVSKERIMLAVENGVEEILVKPFTLGDIRPKLINAFKKFHNPGNPEKVYELAKQFLRQEKYAEAELIYRDLAAAAPKAARPIVGLARIAARQGDQEKALQLLAEAETKNPNYVHLFTERAMLLVKQEAWAEAVAAFKQGINLSPLNAFRYKEAANAMFQAKMHNEAISLLEAALQNKLTFPDLYHYLSQAQFALKDFKTAAKSIRQALSSDPDNVTYLNQLGICLKELGEPEEAQKTYNQVIKIDPGNIAALFNKALLLKAKGETEEAIRQLQRILKKKPDFKPALTKIEEFQKELPEGAA